MPEPHRLASEARGTGAERPTFSSEGGDVRTWWAPELAGAQNIVTEASELG